MTLKGTNIAAATAEASASGAGASAMVGAGGVAAAPGPIMLIVSGIIFSAQTGISYRKMKKGEITKAEFKQRTKKNTFTTTGSIVGKTGGMMGGFLAGQLLIPVPILGGVVGTIVGGFAGGAAGAKVSLKLYDKVEAKKEEARILREKAAEEEKGLNDGEEKKEESLAEEGVPEDGPASITERITYEGALKLLGVTEEDSFATIHKRYELITTTLIAV